MNQCCRHHRDARAPPKQLQTPPMQVPEPAFFPQYPIIINHDHLTSPSVSVIHPRGQWNYAPTNHPRPSPTPTIIFLRMSPYQKSWLGIVRANMLVGVRADPGYGGRTSISHWRVGCGSPAPNLLRNTICFLGGLAQRLQIHMFVFRGVGHNGSKYICCFLGGRAQLLQIHMFLKGCPGGSGATAPKYICFLGGVGNNGSR